MAFLENGALGSYGLGRAFPYISSDDCRASAVIISVEVQLQRFVVSAGRY